MASTRTYRHSLTGKVGDFEPDFAAEFPGILVEVEPDAKPLAYTPIPREAIDALTADEDEGDSDSSETF